MHSSTSSSRERAPRGPWLRTWLLALALLAVSLAAWKVNWTSRGYGLALANNPSAWAAQRLKMKPGSTVLLGTSRMQAGVNPEVWAEETGGETPLQLSLVGTSPLPILKHLAEQTNFHGLVVMGVVEMTLFDVENTNSYAKEALAAYRDLVTSPSRRVGVVLNRHLPTSLLVRHRSLNLAGMLDALWEREPLKNPHSNMQPDRWIEFEVDRLDRNTLDYTEYENQGRPASAAQRDSIIADIETCVGEIQSRGGKVVLVVVPACGKRREIEVRRYPREFYWDKLAAATSALTIYAYDYPELMDFECADGSHLDERDARKFTRALARLVRERT